jgi:hypothetical protein
MPVLTDPTTVEVPSRTPIDPAAPLDVPITVSPDPLPRRTFHLESRGGYLRTVVGHIAYLDREAQTYMVRTLDGTLVRVPLRDVGDGGTTHPRANS